VECRADDLRGENAEIAVTGLASPQPVEQLQDQANTRQSVVDLTGVASVSVEDNGLVALSLVKAGSDEHLTGNALGHQIDVILARRRAPIDVVRNAESPLGLPGPQRVHRVIEERVRIVLREVDVVIEFVLRERTGERARRTDDGERMAGAVEQ